MITIVDYGVGNIASLVNMFDHVGYEAAASRDPDVIAAAGHLVLPGIGAFDHAMAQLDARGLRDPIVRAAGRGTHLLGVCLGMQLLGRSSEEGRAHGLGLIAASAVRLPATDGEGRPLKVPHIGWATIGVPRASQLFDDPALPQRFYFVHSYHVVCDDPDDVAATVDHGWPITIAVSRGNIHGVQFHPEKSHRFGMRLLAAFAGLP